MFLGRTIDLKEEKMIKLNDEIKESFNDKEIVLGYGLLDSKVMLIGEAPGANEVKFKRPFVGQAGKHLDEFLDILNLNREDLYISNVVKFRPSRISKKTGGKINRPPSKKEIEDFKEYLYREIEIINPNIVVTLGNVPLKTILNDNDIKIGDVHGNTLSTIINDLKIKVFPLYHPAAILYRRELRKTYLDDLMLLKDILD